jgi:hypothetical protein
MVNFKRKVFNIEGNIVSAGGIIYYQNNKLLMIRSRGKLEDFGGCVDTNDKNIWDTISREASEESNNIFKKAKVYNLINNKKPVINKASKYALLFVRTKKKYVAEDFGSIELHDNIARTVEWVNIEKFKDPNFMRKNLAWRLRFGEFFKKINNISIKYNKNEDAIKSSI